MSPTLVPPSYAERKLDVPAALRLMKAAPDLLDALEASLELTWHEDDCASVTPRPRPVDDKAFCSCWRARAHAAIRLAKEGT